MIDWGQWHNEPILADGLVILGWLYAILAGPLRSRLAPGEPWPHSGAIRVYAGLGLFYLAAASPFDRVGGLYLFSAHVALQLVILYPAAALIVSGIPAWMIDPWLARAPLRRRLARFVLHPVVTGLVFIAVTSVWYLPRPFEWSLQGGIPQAAGHIVFFGAAVLFWWPLLSPSRDFPPIAFGARMVYLFCLEVALTAVFSYILMADHPMYPTYELAPRILAGLDATNDQILGGFLLSGVSSLVLVGALGVNFLRWAKKSGS